MTGPAYKMDDNDPITLKEACEIVFRNTCTVSTLRAEAERGNLEISKIGKRHYTTLASARELYRKCLVAKPRRGFISTPQDDNGLSETVRISSARAALRQNVQELKNSWRNTSGKNTSRRAARTR